jgi:hypothetical protein
MMDDTRTWVRKSGDIARNIERMDALATLIPLPNIMRREHDMYEMEYLRHEDMATWLAHNQPGPLIEWLHRVFGAFQTATSKDYRATYHAKLADPGLEQWWPHLPFSPTDLISRLPSHLPSGPYHGDLTLENVLWTTDRGFVAIDPLTTPYDSWVFDLAKLAQDLLCGWFIRHTNLAIEAKLVSICDSMSQRYRWFGDRHLMILMLLRILPYARTDLDKRWLLGEINKLWK